MKLSRLHLPALVATAALLAACASMAQSGPANVADGVLVGPNGMTLYTFDRDAMGKSACNGPCAANWPPLMAQAGAAASGDWSIVTRDDGSKQWAYNGKPLYLWIQDKAPGDMTGEGKADNTWHVAHAE